MPRLTPSTSDVGDALERVLGSDTFGRSGRARDLLRYLVTREQAGEADALKGYAIALDVFGRDDEFDPSTDAVVRVQARRLRDLLDQYYDTEGAEERLRIEIPLGSYVPSYSLTAAPDHSSDLAEAAADQAQPGMERAGTAHPQERRHISRPPANVVRHLRLFWVAMGAVIVLLAFVIYRIGFGVPEAAGVPPPDGRVTAAIGAWLPAVHINVEEPGGDVGKVAAILSGALSGFDTLDYIARPYEPSEPPAEPRAEFLFLVSPVPHERQVRIDVRHASTARSIITRDIDPSRAEDMIADLLTSVAPASGAIYAFIANNRLMSPLTDCLLMNDYYYRDPSEELFVRAYDCMKTLEQDGLSSPLVYSEMASLKLQGMVSRYAYAEQFSRESAMECARKAIQLGPTSPYAHRAYGYLLTRLSSEAEGLTWMRKAYELNRFDLSMAASYAYGLVFSGAYAEAQPILERAVRSSSAHPGWWDYSLFLAAFMRDDMTVAANASVALETTRRAHYLAVRMIVAHTRGDTPKSEQLRAEIIEYYPAFAANPREFFVDARYPADLTDKLVKAISAAGLVSAS
ncbi:MAG: hypothetical protein JJ913_10570 [Rhizobiaceae bacterium]|nr:hypothetical protein [Rhizobiaceae bacterium]